MGCALDHSCDPSLSEPFSAAHAINALPEPTFQATCTQLTRASALPIAFRVPGRAVHQRPRQLNGLNANEDSKHKLITLPRRDQAYVGCPPLPAHCASAARAHRASGRGSAQGIMACRRKTTVKHEQNISKTCSYSRRSRTRCSIISTPSVFLKIVSL